MQTRIYSAYSIILVIDACNLYKFTQLFINGSNLFASAGFSYLLGSSYIKRRTSSRNLEQSNPYLILKDSFLRQQGGIKMLSQTIINIVLPLFLLGSQVKANSSIPFDTQLRLAVAKPFKHLLAMATLSTLALTS
jgi:hypothetical protein